MYSKLSIILSIVLLSACSHFGGHHGDSTSHYSHDGHASHSSHASHTANEGTLGKGAMKLSLNGDDKWLMDAHTRSLSSKMANRFSSIYIEQQNQEELTQLGEELGQDLDSLIQGCTMKGDSHNALHNFLTNYMPAIEELKTTGSVSSAKHVEYLLNEYQEYFE